MCIMYMNEGPILNRLLPYVFGQKESPSTHVIFIYGFRCGGGSSCFFPVAAVSLYLYLSAVNL